MREREKGKDEGEQMEERMKERGRVCASVRAACASRSELGVTGCVG